mgnify:CR=1 FL=1
MEFMEIMSTIESILTSVAKVLAVAGTAIQEIVDIFATLAEALGLLDSETNPEELGDKAIESAYNPDDYNSYDEYLEAVEAYEIDPEKSKNISEEDKLSKGMEIILGALINKYEETPMEEFCIEMASNKYFSSEKTKEIAKLIQDDKANISNILNYVNGTERDEHKLQNVIQTLVQVEKSVNPNISDKEAEKNVIMARK